MTFHVVIAAVITELIHRGSGTREVGEAMLHAMAGLEAIMADSERILKTPIPLSYTRHDPDYCLLWRSLCPLQCERKGTLKVEGAGGGGAEPSASACRGADVSLPQP